MATSKEILFYNARLSNTADSGTMLKARYIDSRASPILVNPSRFRVGVRRFSVPTSNIPLVYVPKAIPQWTAIPGVHAVSLRAVNKVGNAQVVLRDGSQYAYSIAEYLNALNDAFATAIERLNTAIGGSGTHIVMGPVCTYDPTIQLFKLIVPQGYQDSSGDVVIQIGVSDTVQHLFGRQFMASIHLKRGGTFTPSRENEWRIDVADGNLNPPTTGSWEYIQEISSLWAWSLLDKVIFRVSGLPVESQDGSSSSNATTNAPKIVFSICDFTALSAVPDGSPLQFNASGPLRWHTMKGAMPVTQIEITCEYEDSLGNLYPLELQYAETMSLKLEFRSTALNI